MIRTNLRGMAVCTICAVALGVVLTSGTAAARELRVCADPNNLPFSNAQMEGFENKIVDLVGRKLDATVAYTWWPQRRGFIRNTLKAGDCDLVSGIASGIEMLRPTRPYYRSGFAFVTRADGPQVSSLDDPVLRQVKIGLALVGEDGSSTPPGHALAKRGIVDNIRGYMIYGDYRDPNPASEIMSRRLRRNRRCHCLGTNGGVFRRARGCALTAEARRAADRRAALAHGLRHLHGRAQRGPRVAR